MNCCSICGAMLFDPHKHLAWHMNAGDVKDAARCPYDGSEVQMSSSGDTGGVTYWTCGHSIRWDKTGRIL